MQCLCAYYFLKLIPALYKALLSIGIDAGPIPCRDKISFLLNSESCCSVVIPLLSKTRLAGADKAARKLAVGFSSCTQIGQTGQLLVLK